MQGIHSTDLLSQLPVEFQYAELKSLEEKASEREQAAEKLKTQAKLARSRGRFVLFLLNVGMVAIITVPSLNRLAEQTTGLANVIDVIDSVIPIPELPQLNDKKPNNQIQAKLASSIVAYARSHKWVIRTGERQYNIFYVRGMNLDGSLNNNEPNEFNDLRVVIEFVGGVPRIVGMWDATADPGAYYVKNPMNRAGTAFLKEGQYRAWKIGYHKGKVLALVQTGGPVTVTRNGVPYTGYYGINQHSGYDYPKTNVKDASAGCMGGRTRKGHKQFMKLLQQDADYVRDRNYTFYTGIINANNLP